LYNRDTKATVKFSCDFYEKLLTENIFKLLREEPNKQTICEAEHKELFRNRLLTRSCRSIFKRAIQGLNSLVLTQLIVEKVLLDKISASTEEL
jgi:hypothetical protein